MSPKTRFSTFSLALFLSAPTIIGCGGERAPQPSPSITRFPTEAFPIPADNQPTDARTELGHLLFFDPVLSGEKRVACASCHLPEKAMADGRSLGAALALDSATASAGRDLPRSTPTIFNVRFQHFQFWDGRAASLEELALMPVENPLEMAGTIEGALRDVAAIPEYRERFAKTYGKLDESSLRRAIASFLRSVTANNAPVDRYLDGDTTALSAQATAGFNLYFGKARCSRCHYLPLFAGTEGPGFVATEFRVTGVPERSGTELTVDVGRAGVDDRAELRHAFKAPTLRNIAHTAPYMHNGAFDTLEQVVDFYDRGGGPGQGYAVPNLDFVLLGGPMGLSSDEKQQLLAFMREGLTDLSTMPTTPASVPSGLRPAGFPR